jgi:hypothetical protein
MTKRTRAWIFYVLVLVFLIVGSAAILYAEGWRAELHPLAFDKVGGFSIRTLPDDAKLFLGNKPIKRAIGLFDPSTLVGSLFPGTYSLSAQKEGYHSWNENVPIAASLVTSRTHIVLVPEKGEAVTSTFVTSVRAFGNDVLFTTVEGRILHDAFQLPGDRLVAATDDGQMIITATGATSYFLTDLGAATSTPLARLVPRLTILPKAIITFSAIPENSSLFLVQNISSLRLIDITTGQVTTLDTGGVTATGATTARIAWTTFDAATGRSVISLYDLLSGTFLRGVDFVPGRVSKLGFGDRDTIFALAEDPTKSAMLYQVDLAAGSRVKMASQVYDFGVAPDGTTFALLDHEGISIFQSGSSKQYLFFRVPDPANITNITWYKDKAHLLLGYKDRVAFLSFEDATLQNLVTVAPSASFAYVASEDTVYTLPGNILTKFQIPQ